MTKLSYKLSYRVPRENTMHEILSHTKQENDDLADAMPMIGAVDVITSYYNPHIGEWYRYHVREKPSQ